VRITDERAEKSLRYLAETDESCAELRAATETAEAHAKAIRNAIYLHSGKSTVADRQAEADSSPQYADALKSYFDALKEWDAVKNKRQTECIVIECWRSIQANQRKGNV
jgi:hypothetical protein